MIPRHLKLRYMSYPRLLDRLLELGYYSFTTEFLPDEYGFHGIARCSLFFKGCDTPDVTGDGHGTDSIRNAIRRAEEKLKSHPLP